MSSDGPQVSLEKARTTAKIMWAAICMGVAIVSVIFIGVIGIHPPRHPADPMMTAIPWGMIFAVIPIGLFVRGQIFKKHWEGQVVTRGGYQTGNIVAWACCELCVFLSLIFSCFIVGSWMTLIPGAIAFLILLSLYPNGKAMFPPENSNPYQQRR